MADNNDLELQPTNESIYKLTTQSYWPYNNKDRSHRSKVAKGGTNKKRKKKIK